MDGMSFSAGCVALNWSNARASARLLGSALPIPEMIGRTLVGASAHWNPSKELC
eukprot:CAMPEP_0181216446 /NCGR_PEP_ID=MMETSP1096-20121128/26593_1 /TAXON_ID=156174 ORGANISM="Chrysochromulina ericina, Strain CCMP281" /NCGR_SAMPLE_ID=MMETSP1096 /ASSEMBLY_ACC=CAM_ASM_000453 /LENGTH=53 /DNA_ID=CAMNT_0023308453 /DNA_START=388 /DNA_END=546 /DNA_ORIENTATION=+